MAMAAKNHPYEAAAVAAEIDVGLGYQGNVLLDFIPVERRNDLAVPIGVLEDLNIRLCWISLGGSLQGKGKGNGGYSIDRGGDCPGQLRRGYCAG